MAIYTSINESTDLNILTEFGLNPSIEYRPDNIGMCALIHESDRVFDCIMENFQVLTEEEKQEAKKGFIERIKAWFKWLKDKVVELFNKFLALFKKKEENLDQKIEEIKNEEKKNPGKIKKMFMGLKDIKYDGYFDLQAHTTFNIDPEQLLLRTQQLISNEFHTNISRKGIEYSMDANTNKASEALENADREAINTKLRKIISGVDGIKDDEHFRNVIFKLFHMDKTEKEQKTIKINSVGDIITAYKDFDRLQNDAIKIRNNFEKVNKDFEEFVKGVEDQYFTHPNKVSEFVLNGVLSYIKTSVNYILVAVNGSLTGINDYTQEVATVIGIVITMLKKHNVKDKDGNPMVKEESTRFTNYLNNVKLV